MKNIKYGLLVLAAIFVIILVTGPYFVVEEGDLAIVTRFGKIIRTETEAGLKIKTPFIDSIRYYPKRIQPWDGDAQLYPTEENQYIWVDITARWQIENAKLFYERLGDIQQAHHRLDQVINANARDIIALNPLRESVRSSNLINTIDRKDVYKIPKESDSKGESLLETGTFTKTTYDSIKKGRQILSAEILKKARETTPEYGIKLIDVVVRQIKYSDDITQSVYTQMIKERNQIAQSFRSRGEGDRAEWLGKMDKDLRSIQSEAERTAKEIKAKADSESLEILNRAYSQDPEFADFWMAMVQYQKLLPSMKKTFSTEMEFFKYLYQRFAK